MRLLGFSVGHHYSGDDDQFFTFSGFSDHRLDGCIESWTGNVFFFGTHRDKHLNDTNHFGVNLQKESRILKSYYDGISGQVFSGNFVTTGDTIDGEHRCGDVLHDVSVGTHALDLFVDSGVNMDIEVLLVEKTSWDLNRGLFLPRLC